MNEELKVYKNVSIRNKRSGKKLVLFKLFKERNQLLEQLYNINFRIHYLQRSFNKHNTENKIQEKELNFQTEISIKFDKLLEFAFGEIKSGKKKGD